MKIFDILLYNDELLINKPLYERKAVLTSAFYNSNKLIEIVKGCFIDLAYVIQSHKIFVEHLVRAMPLFSNRK